MQELIGCVGSVITATRGDNGIGEVSINHHGYHEVFLAWSKDPLPKGTSVLVVGIQGIRTLLVEPWNDL